ncbi:hypothetical protein YSA_05357 [Pseudomonas putida ND6]|uniref:Uncharacterized protein n=1 Tax=Pseudomonas putida ND6 TaxID=231023 RepID=I3UVY9_PSEPU|nr:hypothetical protein YSA_05357 [Pseudomonas putida ND6]
MIFRNSGCLAINELLRGMRITIRYSELRANPPTMNFLCHGG